MSIMAGLELIHEDETGEEKEQQLLLLEEQKLLRREEDASTKTGEDEESESKLESVVESGSAVSQIEAKPAEVENKEEEYVETDIEMEPEEKKEIDGTGTKIYLQKCRQYGITPCKYFLRHISESEVSLAHYGIAAHGMKALHFPLVVNSHITSLDLSDNHLEGQGAEYICLMLKENSFLTELNLANNKLGRRGIIALSKMLSVNHELTRINLSGNGFTDREIGYVSFFILENASLKELDLSHNNFGVNAPIIEELATAISDNESIDTLDLSWNKFRLKSAIIICDGIANNSRLKTVNLAMNGLGNEGAFGLAKILDKTGSITDIDISYNRIGATGAAAIGNAMDANHDLLQTLKIGHNPLGPEGVKAILKGADVDESVLTLLDFSGIEIDKEFRKMKDELCEKREISILHGVVLSDYKIFGTKRTKAFGATITDIAPDNIMEVLKEYLDGKMNIHELLVAAKPDKRLNLSDFISLCNSNGVEVNTADSELLDNMLTVYKVADSTLVDFSALK